MPDACVAAREVLSATASRDERCQRGEIVANPFVHVEVDTPNLEQANRGQPRSAGNVYEGPLYAMRQTAGCV